MKRRVLSDPDVLPGYLHAPSLQFVLLALSLIVVAVGFPATPDELSRIEDAIGILETGHFSFFWPPLSVYILLANPIFDGSVLSVRLFNLALTLPVFFEIARIRKSLWQVILLGLCLPYLALVVSTASQQGLMIAVMGWLVLRPGMPWLVKLILIGLIYAVNPVLIVAIPLGYIGLVLLRRGAVSDVVASVLAYALVIPWIALAWRMNSEFLPTLSTNGPYNLFLGNNPGPLAHRGVGDLDSVWQMWGLSGTPDHGQAVQEFLRRDPGGFVANLLTKVLVFLSPIDHMRSGMGRGVEAILYGYFAVVELALYGTVAWRLWFEGVRKPLATALAFFVLGWAFYAMFFVKVRFRIPFDFLLLAAVLTPVVLKTPRVVMPLRRA